MRPALLALPLTVCSFLATSLAPNSARAEPPAATRVEDNALRHAAKAKAPAQAGPTLDELSALLASSDTDELRLGIESAAASRRPGTSALIVARIRTGLPPELLNVAIDALASLGDPKAASEVLTELCAHRRPQVRGRAILALTMLHPAEAEAVLIKALSDQAPEVRKAAVEGLTEIGTKLSLPPLFRALERDVDGAAVALGKLAEASTVPRVTAYFGRTSFVNLAPILDAVLTRRSLSEELKLSVVEAIVKQGTTEARAYLESISAKLPPDAPARLRKNITEALLRMPK